MINIHYIHIQLNYIIKLLNLYIIYQKQKEFNAFIINKFCNDNDNGFRDFIIDPIIFSNEILIFIRSNIRSKDEEYVCKIIINSMKILENILINLEIRL